MNTTFIKSFCKSLCMKQNYSNYRHSLLLGGDIFLIPLELTINHIRHDLRNVSRNIAKFHILYLYHDHIFTLFVHWHTLISFILSELGFFGFGRCTVLHDGQFAALKNKYWFLDFLQILMIFCNQNQQFWEFLNIFLIKMVKMLNF